MCEGTRALGTAVLEWEKGNVKVARLLERHTVLACPPSPAVVWLRNGAWHGDGVEQHMRGNSGGGGPPAPLPLGGLLAWSTTSFSPFQKERKALSQHK